MISIAALVLVISIGFLVPKAEAQSDQNPKMAPVDQYLMERNAEILLARSAAPDSISSDATVMVLGRQGYETAVRGKNLSAIETRSARTLDNFAMGSGRPIRDSIRVIINAAGFCHRAGTDECSFNWKRAARGSETRVGAG
jgi:hypothetical protein